MKKDKTSNSLLKTNVLQLQGDLAWNGELANCWERVKVELESLFPLSKETLADWEFNEVRHVPFQKLDDIWKIVDKNLIGLPFTEPILRFKEEWLNLIKKVLKVQIDTANAKCQYADVLTVLEWLSKKKSGQLILEDSLEEVLRFSVNTVVFTLTNLDERKINHALCDTTLQIFRFVIRHLSYGDSATRISHSGNELLTYLASSTLELVSVEACPSNLQSSGALSWCLIATHILGPNLALQKLLRGLSDEEESSFETLIDPDSCTRTFEFTQKPKADLRIHCVAAILSVFPPTLLFGTHTNQSSKTIAFWIWQQCLFCQRTSGSSHSVSLHVARTVEMWSGQVASLLSKSSDEKYSKFISEVCSEKKRQEIMAYWWESLESVTDQIRHAARAILVNMMRTYRQVLPSSEYQIALQEVLDYVLPSSSIQLLNRARLLGLKALVDVEGTDFVLAHQPLLPESLLRQASLDPSTSSHAKDGFCALMLANFDEAGLKLWRERWIQLLLKYMKADSQSDFKECLEKAVERDHSIAKYVVCLLIEQGEDLRLELEIIVPVLYTCKKKGLLEEAKQVLEPESQWKGLLGWQILRQALEHRQDHIRLLAFGMIVEGPKTTEKLGSAELDLLKDFIQDNMAIPSSAFLQQLLGYLKKLLMKIKNGGLLMQKKLEGSNLRCVETYREFLNQLVRVCWNSLLPGMNITRRGSALQILNLFDTVFMDSASKTLFFENKYLFDSNSLQILLNCFHDTYESIQEMALQLLKSSYFDNVETHIYVQFWNQSLQFASSAKPPEAASASCYLRWIVHSADSSFLREMSTHSALAGSIGVSNDVLYSVTYILYALLQEEWVVATKSLLEAASVAPMYGLMQCLRHILADKHNRKRIHGEHWRTLVVNLVNLAKNISQVVGPVVNNSSPEGYLPVEFDDDVEGVFVEDTEAIQPLQQRTVSSQMLLVCCWRTIKEVALFLGDITIWSTAAENELGCEGNALHLHTDVIAEIGRLFISMLSDIMHRGAFEQAYAGFCKYCFALYRSNNSRLKALSYEWIQELLMTASGSSTISVTATRRSAGLPFMLQALLAPSVVENKEVSVFNQIMARLLTMAQSQQDPTSSVHSLNILRALFRDSRFAEAAVPYVAEGVKLSIIGFADSQWAVRNSSTLLFAALMTRMFGVKRDKDENSKKNRLCLRLFFVRYPDLLPFLLQQLTTSVGHLNDENLEKSLEPALYPVLLVLGKLTPSVGDSQWTQQSNALASSVMECCQSRVWKIRVGAAGALTSILPSEKLVETLECLLNRLTTFANQQNSLHGTLLQVRALLEEYESFHERIRECIKAVLRKSGIALWNDALKTSCPAVKTVITDIFIVLIKLGNLSFIEDQNTTLGSCMGENMFPGDPVARAKAVEAWLLTITGDNNESSMVRLLQHPTYEVRLAILEALDKETMNIKSSIIKRTIRENMAVETHPEVLGLLLKVYCYCLQSPSVDHDVSPEDVLVILALLRCNSNANLRRGVLELTSRIISRQETYVAAVGLPWAEQVFLLSRADGETTEVRVTLAQILRECSLFQQNQGYATCLIWMALFKLLLDAEWAVRDAAVEVVAGLAGRTNLNQVTAFQTAVQVYLAMAVKANENASLYWFSLMSLVLTWEDVEDSELSLVFSKGEANSYHEPRLVADVVLRQVLALEIPSTTTSFVPVTWEEERNLEGSLHSNISAVFFRILFQDRYVQSFKTLWKGRLSFELVDFVHCLQARVEELTQLISQTGCERALVLETYCCSRSLRIIKRTFPLRL